MYIYMYIDSQLARPKKNCWRCHWVLYGKIGHVGVSDDEKQFRVRQQRVGGDRT